MHCNLIMISVNFIMFIISLLVVLCIDFCCYIYNIYIYMQFLLIILACMRDGERKRTKEQERNGEEEGEKGIKSTCIIK